MRLILGILIGIVLTIGAAYIHDSSSADRQLVNWDVAGSLARDTYDGIRNQISEWTGS